MRSLSLLLLFVMFLVACGGPAAETDNTTEKKEEPTETTAESKKFTLTPFDPSPSFEDAKIETMEYQDGTFTFGVSGDSYELGAQTPDADAKMCANSGKGQHIHLIVDNKPYAAKYESTFDYDIEDGEHHLLAFLSRSYHESIKTDDASVVYKVNVANKGIDKVTEITDPMVFYSRPKGTYVGEKDTKRVMLDFYLANVTLGDAYKVKATINGEDHMIDSWQPYYIDGLPMGKNSITLTLVDGEGNAVDTPLNPVTREFELKADNEPQG